MSKIKEILVLVDSFEKYFFYSRFRTQLSKNNFSIRFITSKYTIYKKSKSEGFSSSLIKNYKYKQQVLLPLDAYEIKSGVLSPIQAKQIVSATLAELELLDSDRIAYVFIWNGSFLEEQTVARWARNNNISTLFFEISNITGKMQVDSVGTNAKSSIANNLNYLDKYQLPTTQYYDWIEAYIKNKLKKHEVKQALNVHKINWLYLIDWFFFIVKKRPGVKLEILNKLKEKLVQNKISYEYDIVDLKEIDYIFFPLQVTTDTQCVINSQITIKEALDQAIEYSKNSGLKLLIKPHPAEKDRNFVKKIIQDIKTNQNVFITNTNTFELIKHSKLVITINSSVGLEAKLFNKDVMVLGDAIYKNMTREQFDKYVDSHLVNIDYFSNNHISKDQFNDLIRHTLLNRVS